MANEEWSALKKEARTISSNTKKKNYKIKSTNRNFEACGDLIGSRELLEVEHMILNGIQVGKESVGKAISLLELALR